MNDLLAGIVAVAIAVVPAMALLWLTRGPEAPKRGEIRSKFERRHGPMRPSPQELSDAEVIGFAAVAIAAALIVAAFFAALIGG